MLDPAVPRVETGCPKQMRHGPCGGARDDGTCEVPGIRCPFLARDHLVRADGPAQTPTDVELPRVLVDFRPDPTLAWELIEAAEALSGARVAVLIGEHVDDPTPHRPSVVAAAVIAAGLDAVATITGRDRAPAEAARELAALADAGVAAVHCVTGDHPAARLGLDTTPRFGLDSIALVRCARDHALVVSVAESPAAARAQWRPTRLLDKQHAGADFAILNHAGNPRDLIDFADRSRDEGVTIPLVAPVPVITDHRSADSLARFPGLVLPDGLIDRILGAADPNHEGVALATEMAGELLASRRFETVNLSGSGSAGDLVTRARLMADIARAVAS